MMLTEILSPGRFAELQLATPELARAAHVDYATVRAWTSPARGLPIASAAGVKTDGDGYRRLFEVPQVLLFRLAGELRRHGVPMDLIPPVLTACAEVFWSAHTEGPSTERFLALTVERPDLFKILEGLVAMRDFADDCVLRRGIVPLVFPLDQFVWEVTEFAIWTEAKRRGGLPSEVIDDPKGDTIFTAMLRRESSRSPGSSLRDYYVLQLRLMGAFRTNVPALPADLWDPMLDALQAALAARDDRVLALERHKGGVRIVEGSNERDGVTRWRVPVDAVAPLLTIARARLAEAGFLADSEAVGYLVSPASPEQWAKQYARHRTNGGRTEEQS